MSGARLQRHPSYHSNGLSLSLCYLGVLFACTVSVPEVSESLTERSSGFGANFPSSCLYCKSFSYISFIFDWISSGIDEWDSRNGHLALLADMLDLKGIKLQPVASSRAAPLWGMKTIVMGSLQRQCQPAHWPHNLDKYASRPAVGHEPGGGRRRRNRHTYACLGRELESPSPKCLWKRAPTFVDPVICLSDGSGIHAFWHSVAYKSCRVAQCVTKVLDKFTHQTQHCRLTFSVACCTCARDRLSPWCVTKRSHMRQKSGEDEPDNSYGSHCISKVEVESLSTLRE